jgi:eukaryotic-like serine/threonine-protein kinase
MDEEIKIKPEVKDDQGLEYSLGEVVGQGGQGMVYQTNYENILVKLCTKAMPAREVWDSHIRWLMTQDLNSLKIARPVARIVEPTSGYVMELMDGLVSLHSVIEKTEVGFKSEGVQEYLRQGGLPRRLKILANLSRTLAELHGRGMAYGDLSPANVFVSDDVSEAQVWLIDCDNICINQRASYDVPAGETGSASTVYSPYYGAPEIIRGEALVSSLTDSWGFGVIAFWLLSAQHPMLGDEVNDGEPELEEAALRGELPWIYHPEDASNRSESGLHRDMIMLRPLFNLFDRCFNDGKDNPEKRPTLSEWSDGFTEALKWLVQCQGCESDYLYRVQSGKLSCDFCEMDADINSLIFLKQYLYDPSIKELDGAQEKDCYIDTFYRNVLNIGQETTIFSFSYKGWPPDKSKSLYSIKLTDEAIKIHPNKGIKLAISVGGSKRQEFSRDVKLPVSKRKAKPILIHVGGDTDIEEVCWFRW